MVKLTITDRKPQLSRFGCTRVESAARPFVRPTWRALRILRPGNALISAVAVLVGAFLAPDSVLELGWRVAAGMVAAFAFAAAGNLRNDMTDVAIDRAAHPDRPLVTGELTQPQAGVLAIALYGLALLGGYLAAGWPGAGLVLVALPLMEAYERWLKQRGLPGNVAIGLLTAAPFILGGLTARHLGPAVLSLAGLAALATIGREIVKDIEDADADATHRRTLPHRVGKPRAALAAGLALGAAILLSPLPWLLETVLGAAYLPAVVAADACFGTAAFTAHSRPSRAQRLVKLGMLLALVALVIGRATGGEAY